LEKFADLTQYGTSRFAEDLEEVRRQLGYEQIDLWGMSYGTRAAQEYIRRYPNRVRSVVFLGSFPSGTKYLVDRYMFAQKAIERLLEDCTQDEACRRAFPAIKQEFAELLERLAKEPAKAKLKHPRRDAAEELLITRETFTEKLRVLLSSNQAMPLLPYAIHQAHGGNYEPFLKLAIPPKIGKVGADLSLYLCVAFTDDIPFLNVADWDRVSKRSFMANNLVKLAQQYGPSGFLMGELGFRTAG
jgi:pimeloyl-ACP methyl ester carboxylesterase